MSQALHTGGFQWVEDCEALAKRIVEIPADGREGFILEVKFEYPKELHDAPKAYPLAPERMLVQKEWLSEYQHGLHCKGVASTEVEKLVPNLRDKDRYVLHYCNPQLYLALGMRLKEIHRTVRFEQSPWIEPYIRMNTTTKTGHQRLVKRPVQTDEQLILWEDHEESPEEGRHQARASCRGGQTSTRRR